MSTTRMNWQEADFPYIEGKRPSDTAHIVKKGFHIDREDLQKAVDEFLMEGGRIERITSFEVSALPYGHTR